MAGADWLGVVERLRRRCARFAGGGRPAGSLLGLECEFSLFEGGRPLDFRTLVHPFADAFGGELASDGGFRYRLSSGFKFYSDGWYAELASPPEPLAPDAPLRLAASMIRTSRWLAERLREFASASGRALTFAGTSLHLSIQAPESGLNELTFRVAVGYGPLFVFMASFPGSAGALFHPRHTRLEIATEHVADAARLRACLTFLIGACFEIRQARAEGRASAAPALPEGWLLPSEIRPGWDLIPRAVSPELMARGRAALMMAEGVGALALQDYLERAWQAMLAPLTDLLSAEEIELAADFIAGRRLAGVEGAAAGETLAVPDAPPSRGTLTFGEALRERTLGSWAIAPVLMSWEFILYRAASGRRALFFTLPRTHLQSFVDGGLGAALHEALEAAARLFEAPVLTDPADAREPSIFAAADLPALLAALEAAARSWPDEVAPLRPMARGTKLKKAPKLRAAAVAGA